MDGLTRLVRGRDDGGGAQVCTVAHTLAPSTHQPTAVCRSGVADPNYNVAFSVVKRASERVARRTVRVAVNYIMASISVYSTMQVLQLVSASRQVRP